MIANLVSIEASKISLQSLQEEYFIGTKTIANLLEVENKPFSFKSQLF